MKFFVEVDRVRRPCVQLWAAAPAAAQAPEERINVTFTPAIATVGDDTELALGRFGGLPVHRTPVVRRGLHVE
jgi:hypothetical protein